LHCNTPYYLDMAGTRTSRVYTISLPPELAQKAEALAKRDSRTMSELFREAFRSYYAQQARITMEGIGEYAAGQNPGGYTEADVPRLIKEVRSEKRARRRAQTQQ
jgi:CopG family transcriptional regulator/antitoxin EndoAI